MYVDALVASIAPTILLVSESKPSNTFPSLSVKTAVTVPLTCFRCCKLWSFNAKVDSMLSVAAVFH